MNENETGNPAPSPGPGDQAGFGMPEELKAGALERLAEPATTDTREALLARMGIDPATMAAYQDEHARLRDQAIATLTAIARLDQPGYGQMDFAGFLAGALTSVAANLGSAEHLVAGRSGSWEADLVFQLVAGTAGWDGEYLLEHRTEPVRIYLSVSRLVCDTAWARGPVQQGWVSDPYDLEMSEILDRHGALPEGEYDPDAEIAEENAAEAKWAARYQEYATRFTTAVHTAAQAVPGLTVPVEVTVSVRADGTDDNYVPHPGEADGWGYDPIAVQLWQAALDAVPVPADWISPAPSGEAS